MLPLWAAAPRAATAGLLLDVAFPDFGWWPLAFVSVALLLLSLIGRSAGGALLVGAAYGAVFTLFHLVWVAEFIGPLPWIALAALQTALIAAGAVLITFVYRWCERVFTSRWTRLLVVPVLVAGAWTLREIVMGAWPYTGFPWARLAMSQTNGPVAEIASWTGVTGLSFLMVALCAAVIQWIREGWWRELRLAVPAAALAAALLLIPAFPTAPAGQIRIGWVQGNGPSGYFDEREPGDVLAAQLSATAPVIGQDVDLLVWPEGAVDSDPLNDEATAAVLDELADRVDAPLLLNAATRRGEDTYNTSLLWTDDRAAQLHDKANPVPFGEYVPDRWLYESIVPELIGLIQREYTAGSNPPYMSVGDIGIGLAICFDVIYDEVIWASARRDAQVFVFQTNNADFRGTDENLQQLAFARMRAIETGRAVVNVSTTGTSQVIAPDGSIIESLPLDEAGARVTEVPLRTGTTPAVILGPWIAGALAAGTPIAVLAVAILARTRPRRPAADARPTTDRRSR